MRRGSRSALMLSMLPPLQKELEEVSQGCERTPDITNTVPPTKIEQPVAALSVMLSVRLRLDKLSALDPNNTSEGCARRPY